MKTALEDDEFELKVRVTPLPIPQEILDKGSFMTAENFMDLVDILGLSDNFGLSAYFSWEVVGCIVGAWYMLNAVFLVQVMRERTSQRKSFSESHGQSKFAYWLARYTHDLLFFLPVGLVALSMFKTYDPQMVTAPKIVLLAPVSMLPFLYVWGELFNSEIFALVSLLVY